MSDYYPVDEEARRKKSKENMKNTETYLSRFFLKKDVRELRDAYEQQQFCSLAPRDFIDFLWERVRGIHMVENFPSECANNELEIKLVSTKKELSDGCIGYKFKVPGWILGESNPSFGTNQLYFFEKGDETITFVKFQESVHCSSIERTYVKKKGRVFDLGRVLKRKEETFGGSLDVLFREVGAGKYVGALTEKEHWWKFLNESTGRICEVTHSSAYVADHPSLEIAPQLEIEYKGFIPGFSGFVEGEKEVVKDLEKLADELCDILKLKLSRKTKLDALKEVLS